MAHGWVSDPIGVERRYAKSVGGSLLLAACLVVGGCAQTGSGGGAGAAEAPIQFASKAQVLVSPFQNPSGTGQLEWKGTRQSLDAAIREELIETLRQSGAFDVVERVSDAEFLLEGTITRFREGSAAGPDEVVLEIGMVQRSTGRALAKTRVTGTPRDPDGEIGGIATRRLRASNGDYRTSIEKAVRVAMIRGVHFIARAAEDAGYLEAAKPDSGGAEANVAREPLPPPDPRLLRAQTKLNALGYGCGGADGRMGPRTRTCIQSYQEEMGLDPTGTLDEPTAAQLAL